MSEAMNAYPEYKDSGLPWLGRIPEHWDCLPHRALFEEVKNPGHNNEQLLSVTISRGIITQKDLLSDSSKKDSSNLDKSKYKLVEPGDLAYNKMRAWQGAVGVSGHRGIISPAYVVQRLRVNNRPEFFHYLYRTPGFAKEAERWSYGITSDQWSLRPEHFKMIYSCVPPRDEQRAIVQYLDAINERIDRFIRNRERLIEVLTEQTNTSARGIMEESNFALKRLKVMTKQQVRPVCRRAAKEYTPVGLYNRGRGMFHKPITKGEDLGDSDFYWIQNGDIIISGQFAWEGAVALADKKDSGCIASHRYPIFRGKTGVAESAFLMVFFRTPFGRLLLDCNSRGAAGRNRPLNVDRLLKEKIPAPPLKEQQEVAELLQAEQISKQIARREITLIREYRTRLISDVVTGKVDVRGAPAGRRYDAEFAEADKELLLAAEEAGKGYELSRSDS